MSTVAAALRDSAQRLASTSDTARLDAELLMAHSLQMSRSDMLLRGGDLPVPTEFGDLLQRRMRHEPVAYILGQQEFYGRDFLVSPEVLIPRGDSEIIIDVALDLSGNAKRVLDLGTGSGALLLTILAERPEMVGIGVDASLGALSVAAANAARLGVAERARLLRRNWHEPEWWQGLGRFEVIVGNPPYVETTLVLDRSVQDFEPSSALFAGPDGLDDYRVLVPQLRELLEEGGVVILEIGHLQADPVGQISRDCGFTVDLFRDLAHRPRALLLR